MSLGNKVVESRAEQLDELMVWVAITGAVVTLTSTVVGWYFGPLSYIWFFAMTAAGLGVVMSLTSLLYQAHKWVHGIWEE